MKSNSIIQKLGKAVRHIRKKDEAIVAPLLSEPTRIPWGPFKVKVQAPAQKPYAILTSTDLKTWDEIANGTARLEAMDYVDSAAPKFSYRFYRVQAGGSFSETPGFSMVANPLQGASSRVADLFHGWPNGTTLSKFETSVFRLNENTFTDGAWSSPEERLLPGEGAIFYNPTSDYKSLSFAGELAQGSFSIPIPSGFSVRSSIIPQPGNLEELGFPLADGDIIHLFDRDAQKYVLHPYKDGKWTAGPAVIGVGESFWVAKATSGNWSGNLVVASG